MVPHKWSPHYKLAPSEKKYHFARVLCQGGILFFCPDFWMSCIYNETSTLFATVLLGLKANTTIQLCYLDNDFSPKTFTSGTYFSNHKDLCNFWCTLSHYEQVSVSYMQVLHSQGTCTNRFHKDKYHSDSPFIRRSFKFKQRSPTFITFNNLPYKLLFVIGKASPYINL